MVQPVYTLLSPSCIATHLRSAKDNTDRKAEHPPTGLKYLQVPYSLPAASARKHSRPQKYRNLQSLKTLFYLRHESSLRIVSNPPTRKNRSGRVVDKGLASGGATEAAPGGVDAGAAVGIEATVKADVVWTRLGTEGSIVEAAGRVEVRVGERVGAPEKIGVVHLLGGHGTAGHARGAAGVGAAGTRRRGRRGSLVHDVGHVVREEVLRDGEEVGHGVVGIVVLLAPQEGLRDAAGLLENEGAEPRVTVASGDDFELGDDLVLLRVHERADHARVG